MHGETVKLFSFLLQVQLTEEELQEIISETRTELRQVNDCYHLMTKKHKTVVTKGQNIRVMYRVIHKSLRDFRPLQYSSRDGHAEGEHVNRGRNTTSFCPTLQVLDMLTSEGS